MRPSISTFCAPLALALVALASRAEPHQTIGGRDEAWWRDGELRRSQAVAAFEQQVDTCEKREAPPASGIIDGYGVGRVHGRPALVPLKSCDGERARLEDARGDLERFEDEARRLGVPPGWLR